MYMYTVQNDPLPPSDPWETKGESRDCVACLYKVAYPAESVGYSPVVNGVLTHEQVEGSGQHVTLGKTSSRLNPNTTALGLRHNCLVHRAVYADLEVQLFSPHTVVYSLQGL